MLNQLRTWRRPRRLRFVTTEVLSEPPAGRWFGQPIGDGYVLRDLLGTQTISVPRPKTGGASRFSPWVWAPDSRRLILGNHTDGLVRDYVEVELPSGRTSRPALAVGEEPVGVLTADELVERRVVAQLPLASSVVLPGRARH